MFDIYSHRHTLDFPPVSNTWGTLGSVWHNMTNFDDKNKYP